MTDSPPTKQPTDLIQEAVNRQDVPKIYANGFALGVSNSDIVVVFQRFGLNPVAILNLSYTLAKTLAQRLGTAVQDLESKIGHDILTTDRIDAAVRSKADEIH